MYESKEEGKDQESIQSSTTPDWVTRNTMYGKVTNTRKHNTQDSQEVNLFLSGAHTAARNKKDKQET